MSYSDVVMKSIHNYDLVTASVLYSDSHSFLLVLIKISVMSNFDSLGSDKNPSMDNQTDVQ